MGNLFYTRPDQVRGNTIVLEGAEAGHATRVLRKRAGEAISITDGAGTIFNCVIQTISGGSLSAEIVSQETRQREEPYLAVAIGHLRKRDRLEFAVEKVTELGAAEILIFKGDHSEKGGVREDRLEKTIESAMKQSLRSFLPASALYTSLEELFDEKSAEGFTLIVADEELERGAAEGVGKRSPEGRDERAPRTEGKAEQPSIGALAKPPASDGECSQEKYLLVIGPEGGFSESERGLFTRYSAIRYSLGEKRLRSETAAIILTDRFGNRNF